MTDKLVPMNDAGQMTTLFQYAMDKGEEGVAALEKLVTLQERMLDRQAVQAFNDAMAEFQAKCPEIPKDRGVKHSTAAGAPDIYRYSTYEMIKRTIGDLLVECGLSYRHDEDLSADGKLITVTCHLQHEQGHTVSSHWSGPTESATRAMGPQQKVGSAGMYGKRKSLVNILGLASCETDNDCAAPADAVPITDQQFADLEAVITAVGGNRTVMMRRFGVENLSDLPAGKYEAALAMCEEKRKQGHQ